MGNYRWISGNFIITICTTVAPRIGGFSPISVKNSLDSMRHNTKVINIGLNTNTTEISVKLLLIDD
jgi:hypothetical protein